MSPRPRPTMQANQMMPTSRVRPVLLRHRGTGQAGGHGAATAGITADLRGANDQQVNRCWKLSAALSTVREPDLHGGHPLEGHSKRSTIARPGWRRAAPHLRARAPCNGISRRTPLAHARAATSAPSTSGWPDRGELPPSRAALWSDRLATSPPCISATRAGSPRRPPALLRRRGPFGPISHTLVPLRSFTCSS